MEEMSPDHHCFLMTCIKHIPAGRPSFATSFDLGKEVEFTTNSD